MNYELRIFESWLELISQSRKDTKFYSIAL